MRSRLLPSWLVVCLGTLPALAAEVPVGEGARSPTRPETTTLRLMTGGGNLTTHLAGAPPSRQMYQALIGVGAGLARMNSYGWRDLDRRPNPTNFDDAMMEAYRHGITPVILLEYEGSYQFLNPPVPLGSRGDWRAAGEAYARRFRPNGDWARRHGIVDWGVTIFAAINEPDVQATIPRDAYHDALAGLAEGVHAVDPTLKVVPGGFALCNSAGDATLNGYGPAIADLLQSGDLDGLDLHTYYNARWFPLTRDRYYSAQSCFDRVKSAAGVTRDIAFYATEYNIARDEAWFDPEVAAALFLTAFWDEMGVVGNDGRTAVTRLAFPWNLGDTAEANGPVYAMAAATDPWRGDARSEVLTRVLALAGDMHFTDLDPKGSGRYALSGPSGNLRVWQNRPGWTDRPSDSWTLDAPAWATSAELWGWQGRLAVAPVRDGVVRFERLSGQATYMVFFPKSPR